MFSCRLLVGRLCIFCLSDFCWTAISSYEYIQAVLSAENKTFRRRYNNTGSSRYVCVVSLYLQSCGGYAFFVV